MADLTMHLHPGLAPDKRKSWRQRTCSPHLQEGSLDSSAGPLSILVALKVLGVASGDQIRSLRWRTDYRLERTWAASLERFFLGADLIGMRDILATLNGVVRYEVTTGPTRAVTDFSKERLLSGAVVIIGLGQDIAHDLRWTLAVGVEQRDDQVTGLLCLDAGEPPPQVAPYNAVLALDSPRWGARQLHYVVPNGRILTASCQVAIAITTSGPNADTAERRTPRPGADK